MRENFSPNIASQRQKSAEAIRLQRKRDRNLEKKPDIDLARSQGLLEYIAILGGLKHFLDYLRSLSDKPKLLDIGAGVTRALNDLSKTSEWSAGIDLKATSLYRDRKVDKFLGKENLILTSVENLRGIQDGSLAGIISINGGVGHSVAPGLAAESINRVLMPSGILKANFDFDLNDKINHPSIHQERFVKYLQHLGYDTSVTTIALPPQEAGQKLKMIRLTAIKPPIKRGYTATDLFKADMADFQNQIDFLLKNGLNWVSEQEAGVGPKIYINKDDNLQNNTKKFNPFLK